MYRRYRHSVVIEKRRDPAVSCLIYMLIIILAPAAIVSLLYILYLLFVFLFIGSAVVSP